MPEENPPRIVSQILGRDVVGIDTPAGFRFLLQVFVGPASQVIARVSSEFPFEKLREGALDDIVEVIRKQLHFVEELKKKRRAAENS